MGQIDFFKLLFKVVGWLGGDCIVHGAGADPVGLNGRPIVSFLYLICVTTL